MKTTRREMIKGSLAALAAGPVLAATQVQGCAPAAVGRVRVQPINMHNGYLVLLSAERRDAPAKAVGVFSSKAVCSTHCGIPGRRFHREVQLADTTYPRILRALGIVEARWYAHLPERNWVSEVWVEYRLPSLSAWWWRDDTFCFEPQGSSACHSFRSRERLPGCVRTHLTRVDTYQMTTTVLSYPPNRITLDAELDPTYAIS